MKRYLADTHVVLWFAAARFDLLGTRARRVFRALSPGVCEVVVSVVSLWEIALLHDEGAVRLPVGFGLWCDSLESVAGIVVHPLMRGDVEEARSLRALRDPHDRLIAGTALRLGVPLITADRRISSERRLCVFW